MSLLIKNGHVIDPASKLEGVFDILVESGKISKVGKEIKTKADKTIDAKGKIVVPGLIDMHVHLREPGREDKETILSGAKAAAKGGFTSIACMPNTTPACDNQAIVKFIKEEARKAALVNVFPIGCITKGREGKELAEIAELKESGCVALSDDGDGVQSAGLMRRALEYASSFGVPIISHCEDASLAGEGVVNEGYISTILGLDGIPNKAESVMIQRDLELAEVAKAKLHIAHISTKEGVALVRQAKERNIDVTAEVTPHHIALTDTCCKTYDTNTKVNPPLRTQEDVTALKEGLKDGTIDMISSDHAPHLESEKDVEFDKAPFGMIGLETALSIAIMELIDTKILTWTDLVKKMSVNPSAVFGLKRGTLAEGAIADITIVDPEIKWIYKEENILSKSKNTPFKNWELKGQATHVIVSGKLVMTTGAR